MRFFALCLLLFFSTKVEDRHFTSKLLLNDNHCNELQSLDGWCVLIFGPCQALPGSVWLWVRRYVLSMASNLFVFVGGTQLRVERICSGW